MGRRVLKRVTRWVEKYEKTSKSAKKELRIINIGIEKDKKKKVENWYSYFSWEKKDCLISLLQEYANIFTWSYTDMLDLETSIMSIESHGKKDYDDDKLEIQ